jgi:hypothetical protein
MRQRAEVGEMLSEVSAEARALLQWQMDTWLAKDRMTFDSIRNAISKEHKKLNAGDTVTGAGTCPVRSTQAVSYRSPQRAQLPR